MLPRGRRAWEGVCHNCCLTHPHMCSTCATTGRCTARRCPASSASYSFPLRGSWTRHAPDQMFMNQQCTEPPFKAEHLPAGAECARVLLLALLLLRMGSGEFQSRGSKRQQFLPPSWMTCADVAQSAHLLSVVWSEWQGGELHSRCEHWGICVGLTAAASTGHPSLPHRNRKEGPQQAQVGAFQTAAPSCWHCQQHGGGKYLYPAWLPYNRILKRLAKEFSEWVQLF